MNLQRELILLDKDHAWRINGSTWASVSKPMNRLENRESQSSRPVLQFYEMSNLESVGIRSKMTTPQQSGQFG